jgi:hypothetical protein
MAGRARPASFGFACRRTQAATSFRDRSRVYFGSSAQPGFCYNVTVTNALVAIVECRTPRCVSVVLSSMPNEKGHAFETKCGGHQLRQVATQLVKESASDKGFEVLHLRLRRLCGFVRDTPPRVRTKPHSHGRCPGVRSHERRFVAHWCTIGVSVILDGPLMHHHRCVGDLGWVADAPEVPSSHRPCRSTRGCPLRVLRGSAVPGVW